MKPYSRYEIKRNHFNRYYLELLKLTFQGEKKKSKKKQRVIPDHFTQSPGTALPLFFCPPPFSS